jgi:hypothetical protein
MVKAEQLLPKRVIAYIHDVGVRTLDDLAKNFEAPPAPPEGTSVAPDAVHTLVEHWKGMTKPDKEHFVDLVAQSVIGVVAASAALPLGLKLGKKAAKATRKVIRKQSKKIRKAAKAKKTTPAKTVKTKRATKT